MIPIVPYLEPEVTPSQRRRADTLARALREEHPSLAIPSLYHSLVPAVIEEAPSLHIDDQSALASPARPEGSSFVQDRARARAFAGDYLVTSLSPDPSYERYCEDWLGLGQVTWLVASAEGDPRRVASHAMRDRAVRQELLRAVRQEKLLYVHPYMGHDDVWELALALHRTARRPVKVIAPPPGLTALVNDKVRFSEIVTRLFGHRLIPESHSVASLSLLCQRARELADRHGTLVVKLPDSAAGSGNLVLDAAECAARPLTEIHEKLKPLMESLSWQGDKHVLVGAWTEGVLQAPSVQIWIPPEGHGDPVVEGLFEQKIESGTTRFVGSHRAELPHALALEIALRSVLLALTFQRLGYIGRCSFDLVLAGRSVESCRIEFIEANGRWGGTSTPMTLVNRLIGKWWERPYVESAIATEHASFGDLFESVRPALFDARTSRGRFVLYNPASIAARGVVHAIAFPGESEVKSFGGIYDELFSPTLPRS
jgi:Pre ATP-grasp domain